MFSSHFQATETTAKKLFNQAASTITKNYTYTAHSAQIRPLFLDESRHK